MKRPGVVLAAAAGLVLAVASPQVVASATGRVTGIVRVEGAPPKLDQRPITKDHSVCGHKPYPPIALLSGPEGGVRNAALTLRPASGAPPLPAAPAVPALVEQKGCEYAPHVQVVPVGTKLKIVNQDDLMHNVHAYDERGVTLFNLAQPFKGLSNSYTLRQPAVVKLVCDSGHPWMRAFVIASDSPWTAVSGEDGSFEIGNVPPGSYRLEIWHEYLGRSEQAVTVPPGGEARVKLSLRAPADPFVK